MYGSKCALLDVVTELLPEWEWIQLEKLVAISEGTICQLKNQFNTGLYSSDIQMGLPC